MPSAPASLPNREKGSGKGLFLAGMITGLAGALLIIGIVYVGFYIQRAADAGGNVSDALSAVEEGSAVNAAMVRKLQTLEEMVDRYYYFGNVTDEALQTGAYKGLMEALNDPYSEYYSAEEFDALMNQTQGIYYGVGAYVSLDADTGLPKISGIISGSPAEKVDLRSNDLIYEVDGVATYGMSLTEVVSLIKGPEGSEVVMTLVRENEPDYLHVTVTRGKVETPTVEYKMLEGNQAYIQVKEFDDVTVEQFAKALESAEQDNMQGLILDLRANPGGSVDAVLEMCRMILPKGLIVYTEDKEGSRQDYTCSGENELQVPLVVLVDMNSASASEIMAGAIKDLKAGTLVGTQTFGKGIIQQIMPFRDGSAVKITISAYYTPSGTSIHGIGIEPDVVCEFDGESYYGSPERPDNQLEKAREVLRGLVNEK